MEQENKMGTMPIGKLLMVMSGPAILSMMINALYNIVDSIFVAQLGEEALTAVSLANPIQLLMIAIGVGTGVGINSLISRRLGARRFEDANNAASSGIKLGVLNWIFFMLFGLFGAKPFMSVFTEDPLIFKYGVDYLSVVCIFSLFVMTGVIIEKIFQSTGNMIYPMITMITGAIVNTCVDPILIFGLFGAPRLEVLGAAISTIIAQAASCGLGMFLLMTKSHAVEVKVFSRDIDIRTIKEIYAVGGPSMIMQALGSIMLFAMNAILATFSATAVAVLGVYGKLQSFVFMPVFGLNQGTLPVIGYNYGARNRVRMMRTYKLGCIAAMSIMAVGLLIFQVAPEFLLSLFNASDDMYAIGTDALKTISFCFIPAGFGIITASLFQATGHGMMSMWGSMIRQFLGLLPMAFVFAKISGLSMVWWAFPLAEIIGTIYFALIARYLYNKTFKHLEVRNNG